MFGFRLLAYTQLSPSEYAMRHPCRTVHNALPVPHHQVIPSHPCRRRCPLAHHRQGEAEQRVNPRTWYKSNGKNLPKPQTMPSTRAEAVRVVQLAEVGETLCVSIVKRSWTVYGFSVLFMLHQQYKHTDKKNETVSLTILSRSILYSTTLALNSFQQ